MDVGLNRDFKNVNNKKFVHPNILKRNQMN